MLSTKYVSPMLMQMVNDRATCDRCVRAMRDERDGREYLIEGHLHVLQTQVVEADHADEDEHQRQHLACNFNVKLEGAEVAKRREPPSELAKSYRYRTYCWPRTPKTTRSAMATISWYLRLTLSECGFELHRRTR